MRISDWSSDVCSSDLQLGSSSSSSLDGNILSEQTHLVAVRRAKQVRPQNGHFLAKAQLAAGDVEAGAHQIHPRALRSEEHTSELQSLMRISYAVLCLKKKKHTNT